MSIYKKKAKELLRRKLASVTNFPKDIGFFVSGCFKLKKQREGFPVVAVIPILGDNRAAAGGIDRHYFLQDIYLARQIREDHPVKHYGIGSRVDGFISHLLCDNIPVTMIDIRPPASTRRWTGIYRSGCNKSGVYRGQFDTIIVDTTCSRTFWSVKIWGFS